MELKKSKLLLSLVVAGGVFCSTASFAAEEVGTEGVIPQAVIDFIKARLDEITSKDMITQWCSKSKKPNIRVLNGAFCGKFMLSSAMIEVICGTAKPGSYENYIDPNDSSKSQCHAANVSQLKGQSPAQVIKDALAKDPTGSLTQLFCTPGEAGGALDQIANSSACKDAKAAMRKK